MITESLRHENYLKNVGRALAEYLFLQWSDEWKMSTTGTGERRVQRNCGRGRGKGKRMQMGFAESRERTGRTGEKTRGRWCQGKDGIVIVLDRLRASIGFTNAFNNGRLFSDPSDNRLDCETGEIKKRQARVHKGGNGVSTRIGIKTVWVRNAEREARADRGSQWHSQQILRKNYSRNDSNY